jgi:pSer/pThr/pTyr-binding forkhead associated (FHA) protein
VEAPRTFKDEATIDSAPQSAWVPAVSVISGPFEGFVAEISGNSFTIGRSRGNSLILDDKAVSRRHAVIEYRDGRYHIHDLESRWGVKLNGASVKESELKFGDELEIGGMRLKFSMVLKDSISKRESKWRRRLIAILSVAALIGAGLLIYQRSLVKSNLDAPGGDVLSKIIYHYDQGIQHYNQMNISNRSGHKEKALEEMKKVIELDPDGKTQFSRSARRIIDGLDTP